MSAQPNTPVVWYWLHIVLSSTLTAVVPFQLPVPQSGTLSRISSRTPPSVQTVSDVYSSIVFVHLILVHSAR